MGRSISRRLHILNRGREPFLNYLRNLTPQVVLLYAALMLSTKMDFNRVDLSNWEITSAFFLLIGAFMAAAWINASNLLRSYSGRFERWRRRVGTLLDKKQITNKCHRNAVKIGEGLKRFHLEFTEFFLVVFLMQIALAIVMALAMQQANSTLRLAHVG